MSKYNDDSEIIITKLYPLVSKALDTNKNKLIRVIGDFFNERHKQIHDIAPYTNILYNKKDEDKLYQAIGIEQKDILAILQDTFFFNLNYKPLCAKSEYVQMLICAIKYFIKKKDMKSAELTTIYLLFTGKFYASLYYAYFKFNPKREIMDYVINNMLTDKFDLKKEKTIFGAIRKLASTWIATYQDELEDMTISDDDINKRLIQQLRDRENSFLKNISNLYYEAAQNKLYLNYESDDLSEENYRLTDNDAAKASRITEATVNVMTSQKVSISRCNICQDLKNSVRSQYIQDILESIVADKTNIPNLRRVINIIIVDFLANFPGKRVGSPEFIRYTRQPKSNTKNELLLELKRIITEWMERYSKKYRECARPGTINAFYNCVLLYFTLTISEVSAKF